MTEWLFRVVSFAAFAQDLDAFTDAFGYAPLTEDDGHGGRIIYSGAVLQNMLRFDFDLIDNLTGVDAVTNGSGTVLTPAVMYGPHVNAKSTILPDVDQGLADAADANLAAQLIYFFATQTLVPYNGGAFQWRTTQRGTALIDDVPARRRRVWS